MMNAMTPEMAKEKICPCLCPDETTYTGKPSLEEKSYQYRKCIADNCMAWIQVDSTEGYCPKASNRHILLTEESDRKEEEK